MQSHVVTIQASEIQGRGARCPRALRKRRSGSAVSPFAGVLYSYWKELCSSRRYRPNNIGCVLRHAAR